MPLIYSQRTAFGSPQDHTIEISVVLWCERKCGFRQTVISVHSRPSVPPQNKKRESRHYDSCGQFSSCGEIILLPNFTSLLPRAYVLNGGVLFFWHLPLRGIFGPAVHSNVLFFQNDAARRCIVLLKLSYGCHGNAFSQN